MSVVACGVIEAKLHTRYQEKYEVREERIVEGQQMKPYPNEQVSLESVLNPMKLPQNGQINRSFVRPGELPAIVSVVARVRGSIQTLGGQIESLKMDFNEFCKVAKLAKVAMHNIVLHCLDDANRAL